MNQKILVPVVAIVLAVGLGIGLWLVLRGDTPKPVAEGNAPVDPDGPPVRRDPAKPNPREFDPALASQDPVVVQRPEPFREPQKMFRLEVSGRVVDEAGLAVPDAQVRFLGEASLNDINGSGFSDAGGRYTLVAWSQRGATPPMGNRIGRVLVQDNQGRSGLTASVSLADTEQVQMPDAVLAAACEIRGRVQDANGTPATGVIVNIRGLAPHEGIPEGLRNPRVQQVYTTRGATTDGRGEFRVGGLRPGKYQVEVSSSYFGRQEAPQDVEVIGAGAAWLDVQVKANNWLRGVVRDSDGQPIAGVVVKAVATSTPPPPRPEPGNNSGISLSDNTRSSRLGGDDARMSSRLRGVMGNSVLTDDQGRFGFFNLHEGTWTINTGAGEALATLEEQKINGPDVALMLRADTVLSGVVRDAETGRPIENFDLRLLRGKDERITPFEAVSRDRAFAWRPGGEWRLINPPEGNLIRVSAPGYAPAAMNPGEVKTGDRRANLEVRLVPICALTLNLRHEGRALELEPAMLLFERNLALESTCDLAGRLRLPAVTPARYELRVILRDGTRLAATIDVPAKSVAALDVDLAKAAEK